MSTRLSYLTVNTHLKANDYLVSDNSVFFAIMQSDGNLCVYRGSGPGDNHGFLWSTGTQVHGNSCYAIVQRDGNFCIYQGEGPTTQGPLVWQSNKTVSKSNHGAHIAVLQDDGNFGVYGGVQPDHHGKLLWQSKEIDPVQVVRGEVKYEPEKATAGDSEVESLHRTQMANGGAKERTYAYEQTVEFSFTKGWAETRSWKVKASTEIKTGIPFFAGGSIKVEADGGESYTNSTSQTKKEAVTIAADVEVPPNSTVTVTVTVEKRYMLVPYRLNGVVVLRSGTEVPVYATGNYKLPKSYDTQIHLSDPTNSGAMPRLLRATTTPVPAGEGVAEPDLAPA